MNTVNISLTHDQIELVDKLTKQYGFANRSEFFRAIIRKVTADSQVQEQITSWPFSSPSTKSSSKIVSAFEKTNRYSNNFLADLAEGLENSDYFSK
jgi:metal-responsive CopG/Arc/MetJ family transcriptional regulator